LQKQPVHVAAASPARDDKPCALDVTGALCHRNNGGNDYDIDKTLGAFGRLHGRFWLCDGLWAVGIGAIRPRGRQAGDRRGRRRPEVLVLYRGR
jgi:hypothetical protein